MRLRGRVARRLGLGAGAVVCAFLALSPIGGVARADAPAAAAYWMRTNPSASMPLAPPNPLVPAGGLYVQQDPSSRATTPSAYAALRFPVPEGAKGVLTLKLTQPAPSSAAVSACAVTSPWQPPTGGGPGPYDQAPAFDTDRCVAGKAAADGMAFAFALAGPQEARPGVFDVAIVPTPDPAPPPFALTYNPPGDSALQVNSGSSGSQAAAPVEPAPVAMPAPTAAPVSPPARSSNSFVAPSPSASEPLASSSVAARPAPAPAPAEPVVSLEAAPAASPSASAVATAHERRWPRVMAVCLLVLLAGALAFGGGQPLPAPRLVGARRVAAAHFVTTPRPMVAGIGRFARVRTAPPHRLR